MYKNPDLELSIVALCVATAHVANAASTAAALVVSAEDRNSAAHAALVHIAENSADTTAWARNRNAFQTALSRRGFKLASDKRFYAKYGKAEIPEQTTLEPKFEDAPALASAAVATDSGCDTSAAAQSTECALHTPSVATYPTTEQLAHSASAGAGADMVTLLVTAAEAEAIADFLAQRRIASERAEQKSRELRELLDNTTRSDNDSRLAYRARIRHIVAHSSADGRRQHKRSATKRSATK